MKKGQRKALSLNVLADRIKANITDFYSRSFPLIIPKNKN